MRLLIIVTDSETYSLLDDKKGWRELPQHQAWTRDVGEDRVVVVSQVSAPPLLPEDTETERRAQICVRTTQRVVEVVRESVANTIGYLAFHAGYVDIASVDSFPALAASAPFNHETGDSEEYVYPQLCALASRPTPNAFDAAVDAIKAKQGRTLIDRAISLRYRVMGLFLPARIDESCWLVTSFYEQYTAEITLANQRLGKRLVQARALLYLGGGLNDPSLEEVVVGLGLAGHETWKTVTALIPGSTAPFAQDDPKTQLFLQVFAEADSDVTKVEQQINNQKTKIGDASPFKRWWDALDEALSKLCQEVSKHSVPGAVSKAGAPPPA